MRGGEIKNKSNCQSKRELKKEAFDCSTLELQASKRSLFLPLQMLHISKEEMTFQIANVEVNFPNRQH